MPAARNSDRRPRGGSSTVKLLASVVGLVVALLAFPVLFATGDAPLSPLRTRRRSIDAVLLTIRTLESGGDYTAEASGSTASGAYQFLDSTWDGYGGYHRAADAPPAVQDAKAVEHVDAILERYDGDIAAVPVVWYIGHLPPDGSPSGTPCPPRTPATGSPPASTRPAGSTSTPSSPRNTATASTAHGGSGQLPDPGSPSTPSPTAGPTRRPPTLFASRARRQPAPRLSGLGLDAPRRHPDLRRPRRHASPRSSTGRTTGGTTAAATTAQGCVDVRDRRHDRRRRRQPLGLLPRQRRPRRRRRDVAAGTQILSSGNTGRSSGPHLHLQIRTADGVLRCPQPLLRSLRDQQAGVDLRTLPTTGCFF